MHKLFVSRNCGGTYAIEAESSNIRSLVKKGRELDKQLLRWEIEDEKGNVMPYGCKVYKNINEALLSGNFSALGAELEAFLKRED